MNAQKIFYSPASGAQLQYARENKCILQTPDYFKVKSTNQSPADPIVTILCTKDLHCYLKTLGVLSELYLDTSMKHGINDGNDNFGLPEPATKDQVWNYIAQRTASFFQAIMNGKTIYNSTGRAEFVDCLNSRGGCSWTNNNCNSNFVEQCN